MPAPAVIAAAGAAIAKYGPQVLNWIKNNGGNIVGSMGMLGLGGSDSTKAYQQQLFGNSLLQLQNQAWQENFYKHRYQWMSNDLEAAGINKLYGIGNGQMGSVGTGSIGMPERVAENTAKRQQAIEKARMVMDWSAQAVQMEKTRAETITEYVNAQLKQQEKINAQLDEIYKKKELTYQDKKNAAELEKIKSEITLNIKLAKEAETRGSLNRAETALSVEKRRTEIENRKPTERTNQWYERNDGLGKFLEGVKQGQPIWNTAGAALGGILVGKKILQPKDTKRVRARVRR